MSTKNVCFHREIREISIVFDDKISYLKYWHPFKHNGKLCFLIAIVEKII